MNLPIKDLLKGSLNKKELQLILSKAELAFNSWEPIWTKFISPLLREEVEEKFNLLNDIECFSDGGYPLAEKKRICFRRASKEKFSEEVLLPIKGITIKGNFLFDRAEKLDFKNALNAFGVSSEDVGDIWLIKDRGAQVICSPESALFLNGKVGLIREIEIRLEALELNELNFPLQRLPRKINSVEASTRLDAIASAGFGLSRSKVVNHIKEGRLRLNWATIKQSSRPLKVGDRVQLEDKGCLEVLHLELTKRNRWRIELLRQ
ncbi:photosystem II S4 domain protein [Prochlorococcus sp. MIT 1223]|uniref:photosystem II S4 domain protein n=1 Tax=Prochlorococcus sp. MIT 1223 TaxID=3096217 RepID=UPI002A749629|nr:photosystem II S4 domain protein [Prochlorococcus sp. MIT 1223]